MTTERFTHLATTMVLPILLLSGCGRATSPNGRSVVTGSLFRVSQVMPAGITFGEVDETASQAVEYTAPPSLSPNNQWQLLTLHYGVRVRLPLPPGEHVSRIELDSLDALELSFAIEQATGVEQPQEAGWAELLTVDAVVQVLSKVANDDSLSSESCAQGGE
jgi:hypothetical protein